MFVRYAAPFKTEGIIKSSAPMSITILRNFAATVQKRDQQPRVEGPDLFLSGRKFWLLVANSPSSGRQPIVRNRLDLPEIKGE
jgi:hypothetical protein